ncbi:MAG: hypothetical protein IJB71_01095 [Bacilli bacterium]|nr:hypothetical protein [Bacilli bacterium]
MKKIIIIPIIVCLVLVIGIIGFIIWNNRIVSTITLDINPSIEINLNKNDKVKSIKALNDDAEEIISNGLKGKSLDDTFEILITNLVEKGYVNKENELDVVLYVDGKITNKMVSEKIEFEFGKKEIHTEIITIDNVTKEDEKLAKEYNVSPAKIAYIKTIVKENEGINVEDLANKSVSELNETKITGKYCKNGYTLEGDWCLKEINRTQALQGNVCPDGYTEHEGKCYEEIKSIETNNYICSDGFKLINNNCVSEETSDALGKCDSGDYDNGYCIKKELIGDAEEFCRLTPATDILMNHRCYGPKPILNGGCATNDKIINGKCVDLDVYYESNYRCKTGDLESDNKCYRKVKTKPTSYYCDGNGELNGTKCVIKHTEKPQKERTCPSGYTPVDDGSRCLNFNKTASKENGYYCEQENSKLSGKTCIIYEMIEAKSN